MLNFPAIQLLHRHADGSAERMTEHSAETHDPERSMGRSELRGARIYRCDACADEVIVQPSAESGGEVSA
jgi:hypothetical protein